MRSLLFVPADSARKLDKAMSSGADALIIDLEDSIALDGKARARESAAAFLKDAMANAQRPVLMVRVNGLQTGLTDADLDCVAPAKPDAIMLPKAEGGSAVVHADAKLAVREAQNDLPEGHIKILPIATETAAALFMVGTFAGVSSRLIGMTWGAEDLSAELGARANRDAQGRFLDPYRLARSLCLAGAAAAAVPAIDTVFVDFRNDAGFRRECEEACRDGFVGKMAIHPAQVPIINEVFTPSAEAIAHAQSVIAAFAAAPGAGVVGIGGVMYDRPHLARAKQLLARAPSSPDKKLTEGGQRRVAPCPRHCAPWTAWASLRSAHPTHGWNASRMPLSDRKRVRREIRASPRVICPRTFRAARRDRSTSVVRYGRRRRPVRL
jgi:citrate lyase subunit beta / citryl-CoA lyase